MSAEQIFQGSTLRAIVIRGNQTFEGVNFFTNESSTLQLGGIGHPSGHKIPAHRHPFSKEVKATTQEVLFIKSGVLRVDLYGDEDDYFSSVTLKALDTILLISGGHGFEVLETVQMIEIKQGPFNPSEDKVRL